MNNFAVTVWRSIFYIIKKYGKLVNASTLQIHHVYSTLKRRGNERFWSMFKLVGFMININSFVPKVRRNQAYWCSNLPDKNTMYGLTCSKAAMETAQKCVKPVQSQQWRCRSGVLIDNFQQISHMILVFPLLTLTK